MSKKRILVSVLNWGLGHATRSIPIIDAMLKEGFEVILASDGAALQLLRKEFPDLEWISLPSYNITYPEHGKDLRWHFLKKSLQLGKAVFAEHRLIKKICREKRIDGIFSDNRLGAFVKGIPSVYCTHQLNVLSGATSRISTKLHQYFINQFSECWIPDEEGERNLSGKLGHDFSLNIPTRYLGIVNRLKKGPADINYDLLVLLSGPEPQRTYLEQKLMTELQGFAGSILLVRGKVEGEVGSERIGNFLVYNYLTTVLLESIINTSAVVIARSGYSTLLDLVRLEKKAFFIPTPGQYEQEYLAQRMKQLKIAPFCAQDDFRLEKMQEIASFSGFRGFASGSILADRFALFKGE